MPVDDARRTFAEIDLLVCEGRPRKVSTLLVPLEGIVADTTPADLTSLQLALEEQGVRVLPSWIYARLRPSLIGTVSECKRSLPKEVSRDQLLKSYSAGFMSHLSLVKANRWILNALHGVRGSVRLGLVSQRPELHVEAVVQRLSLSDLFECTFTEESNSTTSTGVGLLRRASAHMGAQGCAILGEDSWVDACKESDLMFYQASAFMACSTEQQVKFPFESSSRFMPEAPNSVTISDIARTARVSTATVSRTLNQPRVVSDETRRRVLKAVEEMNYIPNCFARRLGQKPARR